MNKNEYKTIKISPELHKKIKTFCVENDFKLNEWIEKQLTIIINEIKKNKNNE